MPCALLLHPWIYDFAAFDLWARPLGLLGLGGLLRECGWEVRWVDCLDRHHPALGETRPPDREFHVGAYPAVEIPKPEPLRWVPRKYKRYGLSPEIVERDLRDGPRPDVVLVTSRMTYWYPGVAEAIALCRRVFPSVPVLLGGTYATLCPEHARRACRPDVLCPGEGESRLGDWLTQALLSNRAANARTKDLAAGVAAVARRTAAIAAAMPKAQASSFGVEESQKGGEKGESGGAHDGAEALDALSRPAYALLRDTRVLPFELTRGCPFRCGYCASHALFPGFRAKSTARALHELEWMIAELGAEDIAFHDDALLFRAERHFLPWAEGVEALRARGVHTRFHAPNGLFADRITPAVAARLRAIGVETVRLSLETTNPERLDALGRRVRPAHFVAAMRALRDAGFQRRQIGAYLLCGLPGQTVAETRRAIDFAIDQGATPRVAEYSPIPGTAEWTRAVAGARLPIADEPLLHNNSIFSALAGAMTLEDLEGLKRYARQRGADANPPGA